MDPAYPTVRLRPYQFSWPIFGWETRVERVRYSQGAMNKLLVVLGLGGWQVVSCIHDESSPPNDLRVLVTLQRPRANLPTKEELEKAGVSSEEARVWKDEAVELYGLLVAGAQALDSGRVQRGRPPKPTPDELNRLFDDGELTDEQVEAEEELSDR
jgi:hypothetical protein